MFKRFLISFILILAGGLSFLGAQNKRVLVVPFDQFQFECSMPLEKIAEYNNFSDPERVYQAYIDSLLFYMNRASDSLILYQLNEHDLQTVRELTPRTYKREPISHNGVDIEPLLAEDQLAELLQNMGADYIMFISRYKIQVKFLSSRGNWDNTSRFISWSTHQVDYEIYNPKGKLVAMADRFLITPRPPREENYKTEGTVLSDLKRSFKKMGLDIEQKLDRFNRKGKVSYKSKVK